MARKAEKIGNFDAFSARIFHFCTIPWNFASNA